LCCSFQKNCIPCVQHIVNYLNEAPESIQVVGIVKEEEIKFLDEIRETTGAKFPIKSIKNGRNTDQIMLLLYMGLALMVKYILSSLVLPSKRIIGGHMLMNL